MDLIIGYIILGVVLCCPLAYLIYWLVARKKLIYPKGHRVVGKYKGFKATFILDKDLFLNKDGTFVVEPDGRYVMKPTLVDIKLCALRCAQVMYWTREICQAHGPSSLKTNKQLKECLFYFLEDGAYEKWFAKLNPSWAHLKTNGFADSITINKYGDMNRYIANSRVVLIPRMIAYGDIAVHEFFHIYSDFVLEHFSPLHKEPIWSTTVNGKTIEALTMDEIRKLNS